MDRYQPRVDRRPRLRRGLRRSEYRLRQTFDIAATPITVPTDSACVAAGQQHFRDARVRRLPRRGYAGQGFLRRDRASRGWLRLTSRRSSVDTRIPSSRASFAMASARTAAASPSCLSSMFYHLDDEDLGALIAYLRTLPEKPDTLPPTNADSRARRPHHGAVQARAAQHHARRATAAERAPTPRHSAGTPRSRPARSVTGMRLEGARRTRPRSRSSLAIRRPSSRSSCGRAFRRTAKLN